MKRIDIDTLWFEDPASSDGDTGGSDSGVAGATGTASDTGTGKTGTDDKGTKPAAHTSLTASQPKYTDEDLDRIISNRLRQWGKQQTKAVNEAVKLATMNEQEKMAYELEQARSRIAEFERKEAINGMMQTSRAVLAKDDINLPDEILACLMADDAEGTDRNVKAFSKWLSSYKQTLLKLDASHASPKTGGKSDVTKQSILDIKDYDERIKAISEHPELFGYGG